MEIDVGLDAAGLGYDDEAQVAVDAARRGYGRIWIGSIGDPFAACALRWAPTRAVVPGGIGTAIGVVPVGPPVAGQPGAQRRRAQPPDRGPVHPGHRVGSGA